CFPTRDHGDDPAFLRGTPVKRKCSVKNELWEWSRASSAEGFTRRLLSKQILTSMSQISCEHRGFAVPMRWRHAGGDLSRPNHANQRADHPSIRSTRPWWRIEPKPSGYWRRILNSSCSSRGAHGDPLRNHALPHQPPQRDQQLA